MPQFRVRYVHPRLPRMHARFVVVEASDETDAKAKVEEAGWRPLAVLELKEPEPIASLAAAASSVDPGAVSTAVDGLTSQAAGGSSGTPPPPAGSPEPTTPHPGGGRGRRGWGSVWSWADRDRAEANASGSTSAGTAAPPPPKPPPPPPPPPAPPSPPPPSPIPSGSSVTAVATAAGASGTRSGGAGAGVPPPPKPPTATGSGDPVVDILQRMLKVLEDDKRGGQGTPGGGTGGKSRHEQAGSNLASQGWNWFTSKTRVGRAVGGVVNRSGAGKAVGDAVTKVGGKIGGAARLGGGAAAGGAAGALGGVAAVAAPVAIAVGAIGAMGAAAYSASQRARDFGYSMEAANRKFADLSPGQAKIAQALDVSRTFRDLKTGENTTATGGALYSGIDRFEQASRPIEELSNNFKNIVGGVMMETLAEIVLLVKPLAEWANEQLGGGNSDEQGELLGDFLTRTAAEQGVQKQQIESNMQRLRDAHRRR